MLIHYDIMNQQQQTMRIYIMKLIDLKQIRDGSIVAIIENEKNEKNEIFILYNDFDDCNLNALKKCNNIIDADFDLNVHLSITTKNKQYDFVVK